MNGNSTTKTVAGEIRNISATLHEMKEEAVRFLQTRIGLLKSELQEKLPTLKIAALLAGAGALLLGTAWLLFSSALVAAAALLFRESDYRWVFAFLSVTLLYGILGGIALYLAKREFDLKSLAPERTIEVLKGDKLWLQGEINSRV
jgi:uncharacterized membrane protein YqjE